MRRRAVAARIGGRLEAAVRPGAGGADAPEIHREVDSTLISSSIRPGRCT